jgi:hypothetical protein
VRRAIAAHRATFRRLELVAEDRLAQGRYDEAAAWAQIAADYAWRNHPGLFASPRLEQVLRAVARATVPLSRDGRRAHPPRRVLHVLTEAYALGGHTRFTWRWMGLDDSRSHSVVLTRSPREMVPRGLKEAVHSRGGTLGVLDTGDGLVASARRLRELAGEFDAVVLNTHPFDAIPTIALADRGDGPPVVMVNHADHVFWLGVGVADVVACIRDSGLALATRRRSIDPSRCVVLPVPLEPPTRVRTRAAAKEALRLTEKTTVLLTVAQDYKYRRADGAGFLDLVMPGVEEHPNAVVIAVGPEHVGEWRAAEERTGGRVRAVGTTDDPTPFYEAADVYIDSYPISSITSLLEATSFGVPVVGLRPTGGDDALLAADDPALAGHLIATTTPAAARATLDRLLVDSGFREDLGRQTADAVRRVHTGAGWRRAAEEAFARARALGPASPSTLGDAPSPGELDELVYLVQSHPGWAARLSEIVRAHIDLLPRDARPVGRIALTRALARLPGLSRVRLDALERRLLLEPASSARMREPSELSAPGARRPDAPPLPVPAPEAGEGAH